MRPDHRTGGTSRRGAPFALVLRRTGWLLWACIPLACRAVPPATCPATRIDEEVQVAHVYDGDTVLLDGGRRLRLIGLNTPELGREGKPDQPLAVAARDYLRRRLRSHHGQLRLQIDADRTDRYGRLLAHAFLNDGTSVASDMLAQGLAVALVVPPNTWGYECYAAAEALARGAGLGLWRLDRYRTRDPEDLARQERGFMIVRGRVKGIESGARYTKVDLAGPLVLRIYRSDLGYFGKTDLAALRGKRVEVRGWIKSAGDKLTVRIRHPAAMRRMD
jgi:micrococcal nuclease